MVEITAGAPLGGTIETAEIATGAVTTAKIANDAVDKDKLGILTTQGDILYYSTEPARLPKGTGLQQLRMNAGATAPEWATAAGGFAVYGGGSGINLTGSITAYHTPNQYIGATDSFQTTENYHRLIIPRAGTIQNFYSFVHDANTSGGTFTIIKNGSATAVTTTHASGTNTLQSDTSNTFSVVAGDEISIRIAQGGAGNFQGYNWGFEIAF